MSKAKNTQRLQPTRQSKTNPVIKVVIAKGAVDDDSDSDFDRKITKEELLYTSSSSCSGDGTHSDDVTDDDDIDLVGFDDDGDDTASDDDSEEVEKVIRKAERREEKKAQEKKKTRKRSNNRKNQSISSYDSISSSLSSSSSSASASYDSLDESQIDSIDSNNDDITSLPPPPLQVDRLIVTIPIRKNKKDILTDQETLNYSVKQNYKGKVDLKGRMKVVKSKLTENHTTRPQVTPKSMSKSKTSTTVPTAHTKARTPPPPTTTKKTVPEPQVTMDKKKRNTKNAVTVPVTSTVPVPLARHTKKKQDISHDDSDLLSEEEEEENEVEVEDETTMGEENQRLILNESDALYAIVRAFLVQQPSGYSFNFIFKKIVATENEYHTQLTDVLTEIGYISKSPFLWEGIENYTLFFENAYILWKDPKIARLTKGSSVNTCEECASYSGPLPIQFKAIFRDSTGEHDMTHIPSVTQLFTDNATDEQKAFIETKNNNSRLAYKYKFLIEDGFIELHDCQPDTPFNNVVIHNTEDGAVSFIRHSSVRSSYHIVLYATPLDEEEYGTLGALMQHREKIQTIINKYVRVELLPNDIVDVEFQGKRKRKDHPVDSTTTKTRKAKPVATAAENEQEEDGEDMNETDSKTASKKSSNGSRKVVKAKKVPPPKTSTSKGEDDMEPNDSSPPTVTVSTPTTTTTVAPKKPRLTAAQKRKQQEEQEEKEKKEKKARKLEKKEKKAKKEEKKAKKKDRSKAKGDTPLVDDQKQQEGVGEEEGNDANEEEQEEIPQPKEASPLKKRKIQPVPSSNNTTTVPVSVPLQSTQPIVTIQSNIKGHNDAIVKQAIAQDKVTDQRIIKWLQNHAFIRNSLELELTLDAALAHIEKSRARCQLMDNLSSGKDV